MCPHMAKGLNHRYYFQYWLSIVYSCVSMCKCAPMWPMIWYIPVTSETVCLLQTHVSFYVPMCPHVANGLSHSYNLQYLLHIVNSCVCMWPFAPMWPIIWYTSITSKTDFPLWIHVFVCSHVANDLRQSYNLQYCLSIVNSCVYMCLCVPMGSTKASKIGCYLCADMWVCAHVPPYGQ